MFFMWAAIFFLIAIVAAAFGFTDIASRRIRGCQDSLLYFLGHLSAPDFFGSHPIQKSQVGRPGARV